MSVKVRYSDELYHFGILGMKWGVRRYQNPDGSLTPEGEKRYNRYRHGKVNPVNNKTINKINKIDDSILPPSVKYKKVLSTIGVDPKEFEDISNRYNSEAEERAKIFKNIDSTAKRIYDDGKFTEEGSKISAIANALSAGYTDTEEIKDFVKELQYDEDNDFSDITPLTYYAYKHNLSKYYADLSDRIYEITNSFDRTKSDINEINRRLSDLGVNGGHLVITGQAKDGFKYNLGMTIRRLISNSAEQKNPTNWNGYDHLIEFANADDQRIKELFDQAEKIASRI